MTTAHPNTQRIIDALANDPTRLIEWAASSLIALGAKAEWSMGMNFDTTETLAALAAAYDLPSACDQDDDALRFYGAAAASLGYDYDDTDADDDQDDTDDDLAAFVSN